MSQAQIGRIAKHVALFIAGVVVTFFALAAPMIVLRPGPWAGLSPGEILSGLAPRSLDALMTPWTTYLLNIVAQMLVFRTVKKRPSLVLLAGLAIGWSAYYWWLALRAG